MKKNIRIQKNNFVLETEVKNLYLNNAGAVVSFVGLVREQASHGQVTAIELEYYPAMTQKALENIVEQAKQRWPLLGVTVIHRVGYLTAQEQIVMVAVASKHRHAAFAAAEFIMDYLKTQAPFWKKEYIAGQSEGVWVEAKDSDNQALAKWQN
ncbi:molybdenum cofactor biosynthesis protein MoaE [uncultured Agitococcus sp.]|mgnify:FL=1|uniref:molybdenum cofactor biosynthesis protein MoaE n=1 Tax=uncultured Agitococcus sp. TaxID=1506599 RepID=UPI002628E010|nr:molybdenum cofactor biosynthesis protein MoaE [uncultured Agitococcus sp.]